MERVSVEIVRTEVYDALQAEAAAHGRSVSEEVATLIEKTYAAKVAPKSDEGSNWVQELLEIGRQFDGGLHIPARREMARRAPPFPDGMEPREGETFIDMLDRMSRPGVDLGNDRDRTPHVGPTL